MNVVVSIDDTIHIADKCISRDKIIETLQEYVGHDVVMYYQRENPGELASDTAMDVINAVCDLGLAIAFPPEAKSTIDAVMRNVDGGN